MKSRTKSPLDSSPLDRGAGGEGGCLEGSSSKPELFSKESRQKEEAEKGETQKRGEGVGGGRRRREGSLTHTKTHIVTATNHVAVYNKTQDTRQQDKDKNHKSRERR